MQVSLRNVSVDNAALLGAFMRIRSPAKIEHSADLGIEHARRPARGEQAHGGRRRDVVRAVREVLDLRCFCADARL